MTLSTIRIVMVLPSGRTFEFPVIPQKISIRDGSDNMRETVLGLGEVVFPGHRKPKEVSWGCLFPQDYDPSFCVTPNMIEPSETIKMFNELFNGTANHGRADIVRLVISEEAVSGFITTMVNDLFTIESFSEDHDAGDIGDIRYEISFRAARLILVETVPFSGNVQTSLPHPVPSVTRTVDKPQVVTAKPGDTALTLVSRFDAGGPGLTSGVSEFMQENRIKLSGKSEDEIDRKKDEFFTNDVDGIPVGLDPTALLVAGEIYLVP